MSTRRAVAPPPHPAVRRTGFPQPRRTMKMTEPVKLKRARGALLRWIRAGITRAPPGYMTQADCQREDEEREKRAKEKRRAA